MMARATVRGGGGGSGGSGGERDERCIRIRLEGVRVQLDSEFLSFLMECVYVCVCVCVYVYTCSDSAAARAHPHSV